MKTLVRSFFVVLFLVPCAAAQTATSSTTTATGSDAPPGDVLDRDELVRQVLERNPTVEAARLAWQAALQREPQETSLDDPVVSYAAAPLSIGSGDVRYGQVVQFRQALPFPGKRGLRGQIARALAEATREDYEAVRLQLATTASLLFDDDYFVHRALEINDAHIELLEEFRRIATVRYTTGAASQQDPIQAEVEMARLLHRRIVLETRRRTVTAQINALLHRRPEEPLPPPPATLEPPPVGGLDAARLQEEALAARPELRAIDARLEASAVAVKLREKDFHPDFEATTTFNSMWGVARHRWLIGVGIRLPLRRERLHAAVAEARARLESVKRRRTEQEDAIRTEVYLACQRLEEAAHVIELYRSRLLPASRDQVRAARVGFETGRNSFLALIEAERNQRTMELGYEAALTDFYRGRAELDRALGRIPVVSSGDEAAAPIPKEEVEHESRQTR